MICLREHRDGAGKWKVEDKAEGGENLSQKDCKTGPWHKNGKMRRNDW